MLQAATGSRRHAAFVLAAGLASLAIAAAACSSDGTPTSVPGSVGSSPARTSPVVSAAPTSSPEASAMATPIPSPKPPVFAITSTAFIDGDPIPTQFTCRGQDVSPQLAWTGAPTGTSVLVLLVDDPDGRDWVHWTVLDLPPADGELQQAVSPSADPPQQGRNDFGKVGYGGPCPPSGNHHYRFTLYALAAPLGLAGHPDGSAVRGALAKATVLATVTLEGTFRA